LNKITEIAAASVFKEMDKAITCLALELPSPVYDDVEKRWENLKTFVAALDHVDGERITGGPIAVTPCGIVPSVKDACFACCKNLSCTLK
jgi:hypothetical protein